jgi:lactoylglutathione lyase
MRGMPEVASLVLYANDPARTGAFYTALGLRLEPEDHGEGPLHLAVELGTVHVAIYPAESPGNAPKRRQGGSSFPGFYVESLDEVPATLQELATPILSGHENMPWGCRVVVEDPDGRAVEVNQRGHCD